MELWFSEFHTPDVKHSLRVNRHLYSQKSNYQQIDIYDTPEFGKVLTLDGNVMLTERDEFIYDEMITHVPMAVHPNVQDVLVIGAGDGGVVKELARYESIRSIDLVEMDEQVVEACRRYLPENACRLDDQRVHIYFDNALRFIRRRHAQYDLIIVDSTDPFGPSEGYFTREFYGICYNALRDDGIMVNQQGSPFYRHDAEAMQRCHKRIVSTFPISRVYQAHIPTYAAGYWLFGFASKKYHPIDDFDRSKWLKLHLKTKYYTVRLHTGAFFLPAFLEEMLEEVAGDALLTIRRRFPDFPIALNLSEDILYLPMEPMLIKQVIVNLLENAIRHSGDREHIQLHLFRQLLVVCMVKRQREPDLVLAVHFFLYKVFVKIKRELPAVRLQDL